MFALEKGLRELALMIGGVHGIGSVVTDRHKAVTKMMREKFPGIEHYFDPWHFFRNITLSLVAVSAKVTKTKPIEINYRLSRRSTWNESDTGSSPS